MMGATYLLRGLNLRNCNLQIDIVVCKCYCEIYCILKYYCTTPRVDMCEIRSSSIRKTRLQHDKNYFRTKRSFTSYAWSFLSSLFWTSNSLSKLGNKKLKRCNSNDKNIDGLQKIIIAVTIKPRLQNSQFWTRLYDSLSQEDFTSARISWSRTSDSKRGYFMCTLKYFF